MNVRDLLNLEGKVILVSGGSGLYGKSIVEGLSEAGGTVITASRDIKNGNALANELRAKGLDIYALQVDQGDHESIVSLKEEISKTFGRLDVFVNNAVARPMKGYDDSMEHFAESMRINATGMMDIVREMCDLIGENGGGNVINIASMMGMYGPDLSNYVGSDMGNPPPDYFFHRAGIINLTRYLARVLANSNIRVNSISPGGLFNNQHEKFLENYCKKVPVGRMANNDDIKGLIVLLASDAGAYINGQNILMDGGMHA